MSAVYLSANSTAIKEDPPAYNYIDSCPSALPPAPPMARGLNSQNAEPSKSQTESSCRVFLFVVISLIIGCAIGCLTMYFGMAKTTYIIESSESECVKPRRTNISDFGDPNLFQGWVDVQGQGAANDYCRVVLNTGERFLSCALAGSIVDHQYTSPNPSVGWFDQGYADTWYMADKDGDGRDDYCRCVGSAPNTRVSCMKAGVTGFMSQHSFQIPGTEGCERIKVNPSSGTPMYENDCLPRCVKPRRTHVVDLGDPNLFRGWVDVQGQGAANDYCRVVSTGSSAGVERYMSCALAGSIVDHQYTSPNPSIDWFDVGYGNTWYMADRDGDGRDDYCRCVGNAPNTYVSCMKAGVTGFISQYSYQIEGSEGCMIGKKINPFFGLP